MKKYLLAIIVGFFACTDAWSSAALCPMVNQVEIISPPTSCTSVVDGTTCLPPCTTCRNLMSPANSYHVIVTNNMGLGVIGYTESTNGDGSCTKNCGCVAGSTSYSCASGYYGNPTSETSTACKACPDNATCDGGTTFTCNAGYYQDGSVCAPCPPHVSSAQISPAGSTAVTACYVPGFATWTDDKGTQKFSANCSYSTL